MEIKLRKIENMVLIGATGQNSGKTTMATELISQWKENYPVVALKITTIKEMGEKCQRGGSGCGACTNISNNFELTEEIREDSDKDTSLLLAAGARKVHWLRSLYSSLDEALDEFLKGVPDGSIIICESNSLRKLVEPGCFLMLKNTKSDKAKPTAAEVIDLADAVIENDFGDSIKNAAEHVKIVDKGTHLHVKWEK